MATGTKKTLTKQQELFIREYLVDLNATQAAIRAGYSKKTAASQGQRLLKNVEIKEAIDKANLKRQEKTEITAERVLKELYRLAMFDPADIIDEHGNLLPIKDMPEDARRCITALDIYEEYEGRGEDRENVGQTKKLKMADKVRSLQLLGQHLKLFTEVHEVKHTGLGTLLSKIRNKGAKQ